MLGALGWAAALTLAVVFAVAGVAKLADRRGTRATLEAFGLGAAGAAPAAVLVPLAEVVVAILVVLPPTRALGGVGALALLALFSTVVGVSLARGRAPACHCFGQAHATPVSRWTLARNAGLTGLGVLLLAAGDATPSTEGVILVGAGTGVAVALGASAAAVVALMRSHGRLLVRLDGLEDALAEAGIGIAEHAQHDGLEPGDAAPAFSLAGVGSASLDALLEPGLPVLLAFTSPGCAPCDHLLPRLAAWQHEHRGRLSVAVLSAGDLGHAQAEARAHGLTHVLVDAGSEVFGRYAVSATPGAVLVAADGTIASWAVAGEDAITSLVDAALTEDVVAGLELGAPAPELELFDLDGGEVRLRDPDGRATLLIFWDPACGFCSSMRDDLLNVQRAEGADTPRLLVVSSGDAAATRADGFAGPVALDPGRRAGTLFGATGTPMGLLLDGEGRVASPLAAGAEAVLALTGPPRLHVEQVGR